MAFDKQLNEFDFPVIDADCHIYECHQIFTEYLEPEYRERLRGERAFFRVSEDPTLDVFGTFAKGENTHNRGMTYHSAMDSEAGHAATIAEPGYRYPGCWDPEIRLKCMDAEGIDAGIVRSTSMPGILLFDDIELVNAACRAYNNWVHDFCSVDPNRFYPESLLPCGDMDLAIAEFERTAAMGFKSVCLPGSTAAPKKSLSDPYWEPLFSRMQETGMPLCIHAGFNPSSDSSAQFLLAPEKIGSYSAQAYVGMYMMVNFLLDNIVTLGEITLGGMCDRFPNLNVYFIESGHSWIGEALYRYDKIFASPPDEFIPMERLAKTKPSEIFERQIYTMFEGGDRWMTACENITKIADNLLWASDIPHWDADGPWEGGGALMVIGVSDEVQRKIMGENFARILGIPYEKRIGTSNV